MTVIRLFIVNHAGHLASRLSANHATAEEYRWHNAKNWPGRKYIAWEYPAYAAICQDARAERCLAAIERGNHFGSREEALALLATVILESS